MIDRLLWRAIGLLVELDTLGHAVTDRLLSSGISLATSGREEQPPQVFLWCL